MNINPTNSSVRDTTEQQENIYGAYNTQLLQEGRNTECGQQKHLFKIKIFIMNE
jgi:hypothetical protein